MEFNAMAVQSEKRVKEPTEPSAGADASWEVE